MTKRNSLEQVRALIDDVDGVAFGAVGATLDEMATACDRAIVDRLELVAAAQAALNYIENTEGELGIKLSSGDKLRAALEKSNG